VIEQNLARLAGETIVVTEKMDGENTTLYHDGFHARSVDSRHHPSRSWLADFHARISWMIPDSMRICGENMYAQHSIRYQSLPSYFLGFSVWFGDQCLPWHETLEIFQNLGITPVPELYRGPYDPRHLKMLARDLDHQRQEGYVVRLAQGFAISDFGRCVFKYVRAGHVQTSQHWQHQAVVPNQLQENPNG
jgi:hypothetical protein